MPNNNTITSVKFKRGNRNILENALVGSAKPARGEPIWEINTNKLKIGDGIHNYADLPYITGEDDTSDLVITGYYDNNYFYHEAEHITTFPKDNHKLYYDIPTGRIYYYSEDLFYHRLVQEVQVDSSLPGLVKMYSTTGNNTDGTMTQYAITTELDKKVELSLAESDRECITFKAKVIQ